MTPIQSLQELTQSVNFPGFFITEINFDMGQLRFHLARRFHSARCRSCGRYCGNFHDSTLREFRDLDWGGSPVFVAIKRVRVRCPKCGIVVESLPFARPGATFTRRLERAIGRMCQYMTRKDAADFFAVSQDSAGRFEWSFLQQQHQDMLSNWVPLRQLQFDEIAKRKGHHYVTVFTNCETGQAIGVVDGRKKEELKPFFEQFLGREQCEQIEAICIDMSKSYIAAVREHCPNATLIFDRFHVVKHLNEALYQLAKSEKMKQPKKEQEKWKHLSRVLGKNPENLTRKQRQTRNYILWRSPVISAAYELKEAFRRLWDKRTKRGAKTFLTRWLKKAKALGQKAYQAFCKMVEEHRKELLNYYDYKLTNGPQEGRNNKFGVIRRRAYGYRNVDWYALKIIQATMPKIHPFAS